MKKFTKILENIESGRFYEVFAELKILIKAENEGEAGYISDSILGSIENQVDFTIQMIQETTKEEYQKYFEGYYGRIEDHSEDEVSDEEKVLKTWEAEFDDRTPSSIEKMEFYHKMRSIRIGSELIMKILKNKLLGS